MNFTEKNDKTRLINNFKSQFSIINVAMFEFAKHAKIEQVKLHSVHFINKVSKM